MKLKNVRWFLSVNYDYIPEDIKEHTEVLGLMEKSLSLVKALHTKSYEHILNGGGFGLETQ